MSKLLGRAKAALAGIRAIGAVRRRGWGALKGSGGRVHGEGIVTHKDGSQTKFILESDLT
jgi:hypothetical protein